MAYQTAEPCFRILDAVAAPLLVVRDGTVTHANAAALARVPAAVGSSLDDVLSASSGVVWSPTCAVELGGTTVEIVTGAVVTDATHAALVRRLAHDLRGPVASSAMAAQHLERILPPDPLPHELVTGIRRALGQATELLRTLEREP